MLIKTYIEEEFKDYSDISIEFDIPKKYKLSALTYGIDEEEELPLIFEFLVNRNEFWEYILSGIIITWDVEKYFDIKKLNKVKLEKNNDTLKICFTSDCVWTNQLTTKKNFYEHVNNFDTNHPFSKIIVNYAVQKDSIKIVDITIPDYKEIILPEYLTDIVVETYYEKN